MAGMPAPGMALKETRGSARRRMFRSALPAPAVAPDILERLYVWADRAPDRVLLSEPGSAGRRALRYAEAARLSLQLAALLAERYGLRPGDRIASLAPAGVEALALKLACLRAGFVHVALPPYPFRTGAAADAARPYLAVAQPKLIFGAAGVALAPLVAEALSARRPPLNVDHAPSDWAAVFFTSGSTGAPKGVPITRAMISSNQSAIASAWPFVADPPIAIVDWLPWHHVFGGLDNIFKVVWNGGTMHVDAAPSPATIAASARLMADVGPSMHIGVPLGLKLLLDCLETDEATARAAVRNLQALFFAGAGIEAALWARLRKFRDTHGAFEILSGYGATEAASTICLSGAPLEEPGELGCPLPGHEVALTEIDGRTELSVRGPNVAPGYLTENGLVPLPVDEDGFYRTGDAATVRLRADGRATLAFDGRLAEDFKLSSGVKVRAGALRAALLAHCAPFVEEIVVGGENRDELVAVVFAGRRPDAPQEIARALAAWNLANPASSTRIARFALADVAPDRGRGEVSDKGQIVRSVFLRNHAALFEALAAGEGLAPGA